MTLNCTVFLRRMPHVPKWGRINNFRMVVVNVQMSAPAIPPQPWDKLLTEGHQSLVRARRMFRYLPSAPRCKVCNNPFGGPAGRVFAAAGFRPSRKNPNLCSRCCDALPAGGAEVDVAVLFADVRGSTALGQRAVAADFAALLNRFYIAATRTLLRHDAVIDKLIGDEVRLSLFGGSAVRITDVARSWRGWSSSKRSGMAATRDLGSSWAWRSMRVSHTSATLAARWLTSLPSVIRSTSRRGCNNTPPGGSCWLHPEWPMSSWKKRRSGGWTYADTTGRSTLLSSARSG
jgi:hypothetical protein